MQILRHAHEWKASSRKVCVAIGMFDGVHLGHQQVIRQTILDARQHNASAVVVTFDRHPSSIVAPERTPPLIYSLPQKLRAIRAMGADAVLLIEFTREFSEQSGEAFIRQLVEGFGQIYSICVGSNFTFGRKRSGNVALLKGLGEQLHFTVHGLSAVALAGEVVSSTRIRQAIAEGDLDAASQMLGRSYSVAGQVIEGDKIGRQIGFPTANLDVEGLVLPPDGVYAVRTKLGEECLGGAANIGIRPTVQNKHPERRLEVHLLDFSRDIYGFEMEISFVELLRAERKFASREALQAQIAKDIEQARLALE